MAIQPLNIWHKGSWHITGVDTTPKPLQSVVYETLQLNAGSHTWEEQLRLQEERTAFFGRTIILMAQDTGRPKLKTLDHWRIA